MANKWCAQLLSCVGVELHFWKDTSPAISASRREDWMRSLQSLQKHSHFLPSLLLGHSKELQEHLMGVFNISFVFHQGMW